MDVTLQVSARPHIGTAPARRLRAAGQVPAVVYGAGIEGSISVVVGRRDLAAALNTDAGRNALITVQVDGDSHLTLPREIQVDPVRNEVVHVDFVAIRRDQEVSAEVPIVLTGDAPAVRNDLLVAEHLFQLQISCLPGNLPDHIEVDISGLENVGDVIRTGDLALPEGVTLATDPEEPIVMVTAPRVAEVVPVVEEEGVEGAEPGAEETSGEGENTGAG